MADRKISDFFKVDTRSPKRARMSPPPAQSGPSLTSPQPYVDPSYSSIVERKVAPVPPNPAGRDSLQAVAKETLAVSAGLKPQLPSLKLDKSAKFSFTSLQRLDPNACPLHPRPAVIKVINEDSVNAAVLLAASAAAQDPAVRNPRPAVVNFANHHRPGGGWLNGAVAQEEAICYRTSLALALDKTFYPLAMEDALYTPDIVVIREDMASGHALYAPATTPAHHLPVMSALSVAAILRPPVHTFDVPRDGGGSRKKPVFARDKDRGITKAKMRLCLRMAAVHGHGLLVLGALGCGVFANPPEDVAHCWLEVLRENEFSGNWWREVCFAVYEPKGGGNFAIFKKILGGKEV